MDDQGGAGGVPLHGDDEQARHRAPHHHEPEPGPGGKGSRGPAGTTRAADTDEASRLDRPAGTEGPGSPRTRWTAPEGDRSPTPRRQHSVRREGNDTT
ncbi:hypothetical protein ACFYUL_06815 [Streptomyces sp. NPDC004311]|uniref:hypothetical protein n=1 Tax=Streptomyces sp. NPDC004311 TaxID=3364698 RepID=UPI0036B99E32